MFDRVSRILVILFLGLQPSTSIAGPIAKACSAVFEAVRGKNKKKEVAPPKELESSGELEMVVSPKLMEIFTTTDGTLAPLFHYRRQSPPPWLVAKAGSKNAAKAMAWDKLSIEEKTTLLTNLAYQRQSINFYRDRVIHGLRVRPKLKLQFFEQTEFNGKTYERGEHLVEVDGVLPGRIEYMGPADLANFRGVELHYRGRGRPGDITRDMRTFQDGRFLPVTPPHLHMTARVPKGGFNEDTGFHLTSFYRQAETAVQMFSVAQRGRPITRKVYGTSTFFSPLLPRFLREIRSYLSGNGGSPRVKDAYVGFAHEGFYDAKGIWGLEVRSVPGRAPKSIQLKMDRLLNRFRDYLDAFPNNAGRERAERWRAFLAEKEINLVDTYYNRSWQELFRDADPRLKEVELASQQDRWRLEKLVAVRDNVKGYEGFTITHPIEVKMLVHNWGRDIHFFDRPEAVARIVDAQTASIAYLRENPDANVTQVVGNFLRDSGLFKTFSHHFH